MLEKYLVAGFECWLSPATAEDIRTGMAFLREWYGEDAKYHYSMEQCLKSYSETRDLMDLDIYSDIYKSLYGTRPVLPVNLPKGYRGSGCEVIKVCA